MSKPPKKGKGKVWRQEQNEQLKERTNILGFGGAGKINK